MRQQNRDLAVGRHGFHLQGIRQRQIGGQGKDTGQWLWITQAGVQHDGTALRKSCKHDTLGRDAAVHFALDQCPQLLFRLMNPLTVLAMPEVGSPDVIPGGHFHATVDGHAAVRGMRQDHTHPQCFNNSQLRD